MTGSAALADGEREYLQGVIEFYRARAETKMTIAAERLAVIAVVTLPITALSSIYGMNIIVNNHTHVVQLIVRADRHGGDVRAAAHLGQTPRLVVSGSVCRHGVP